MLKTKIKNLVKKLVVKAGGYRFFLSKNDVPIFMFHRVLPDVDHVLDSHIALSTSDFENILLNIKSQFNIICLKDVIDSKLVLHNKSCIITFDDGWLDNYTFAFPILKKYNVKATIFLPTNFIDTLDKFWFQKLSDIILKNDLNESFYEQIDEMMGFGLKQESKTDKKMLYSEMCSLLKNLNQIEINKKIDLLESSLGNGPETRSVLNWEEIYEMGKYGITFGSHGLSHSILTKLDSSEKYNEIFESKKKLLDKNINYVNCFSFPNGNYDQESLCMAESANYELLLSASINKCGSGQSRILTHRINVTSKLIDRDYFNLMLVKAKFKRKIYLPPKQKP